MAANPDVSQVRLNWSDPTTGEHREYSGSLPISLGRADDNTIVLNSSQISRHHARLELDGTTVMLVDAGSTNGVYVGQQRVSRAPLADGATFQIGPFSVVVDTDMAVSAAPATPAPPIIRLMDSASGQTREIAAAPPITFGRDGANVVVLSGAKVSRRHAVLDYVDGQWILADLQSGNGTFVNGQRITRVELRNGDKIIMGDLPIVVLLPEPVPPDPEHAPTEIAGDPQNAPTRIGADPEFAPTQVQGAGHQSSPSANVDDALTQVQSTGGDRAGALLFSEDTDALTPDAAPPGYTPDFPPPFFSARRVAVSDIHRCGLPVEETTYLALGAGIGSFVWVDHLVVYGVDPGQIVALGLEERPHSRYQRICRYSQIPDHERLRSNSDSCPDNLWGWPGYAVREIWGSLKQGQFGNAAQVTWQIFGEPTFADTYTPRAGDVFRSIDREAERIRWPQIWRFGRIRAIRQTDDDRYVIAYSASNQQQGRLHKLIVAKYVQLAIGYPGVRFLPDLQEYRDRTNDYKRVVNAYEDHDHIYAQLQRQGGTVMIRGRGIVASRILQRLSETRQLNPKVGVLHLMRTPLARGNRYGRAERKVEHHWEFQPFNWPKACWSGALRVKLEQAGDAERDLLLNDWGGTTTANRADWRRIVDNGVREGWYQIRFGEVERVEPNSDGRLVTVIRGKGALQEETTFVTDFVIDCTGLEARIESNPLLHDMVKHYQLPRSPKGRLKVANDFELLEMRNGTGRLFASGAMTLGGPMAAVDSFLGLQYAALRSVDALTRLRAPGLRRLNGFRSFRQWVRWARGVRP